MRSALVFFLLVTGAAVGAPEAATKADLQYAVSPSRILLSDTVRNADFEIRNLSGVARKLKLQLVFFRFKENDEVEIAPYALEGERSAMRWLRLTARTVTLAPHGRALVRITFLGPPDLLVGDYRAHVHLQPDPPVESTHEDTGNAVRMRLKPMVALAVPVVVRQGKPIASVAMGNFSVEKRSDGKNGFRLHMTVEGSALPFGELVVSVEGMSKEKSAPKARKVLATIRGLPIYWPERTLAFPFSEPLPTSTQDRLLVAEFREPAEKGGKVLGRTELVLGKTRDTASER